MSLRSTWLLVRFLLTFISRRVLGRGILRSRSAKTVALMLGLTAFVGYCLLTAFVLEQYFDSSTTEILLTSAGVATPLWVLIAYTVIRVLFLKADELTALTFTLPATNRERALAFSAFEAIIVMAVAMTVFGAFIFGAVYVSGIDFLADALFVIVFPALLCYFLFSALYLAFERATIALGVGRLRGLLMPIAFTLALVVMFLTISAQTEGMFVAYVAEEPWSAPQLLFLLIADQSHPALAIAAFFAALALCIGLVLWLAPRDYEPLKRHYRVLSSRMSQSALGIHLLAMVRSFETLIVIVFSLLALAAMVVFEIAMPPFVIMLVTFQGVYAFANTDSIRRMTPRIRGTSSSYLSMIGAQVIVVAVVAVPSVIASSVMGIGMQFSLLVVGFSICNIFLTTLIGIMFPADKGNPFSVLIGVVLVFAIVAMLAVGVNLFDLPLIVNVGVVIFIAALAVGFSITGMNRIERNRRYDLAA